jgi:hypothetical protein
MTDPSPSLAARLRARANLTAKLKAEDEPWQPLTLVVASTLSRLSSCAVTSLSWRYSSRLAVSGSGWGDATVILIGGRVLD